ncbi:MAG TPA: alpha-L-fucosidase, partial [Candidatus Brocadiia bacterium]|nr:alpha-L-fucosidase [Candidatus Brocadiia bacterium]
TDFKITNTPCGKDVTAQLVDAFRRRGLRVGLYHSLVDWRHPQFTPDPEHPLGKTGAAFPDRDMARYRPYLYEQVRQLLTEYGKIDLLFFDYTSKHRNPADWEPEKLLDMVYALQPDIIVNDRLTHAKTPKFYGDYATPEVCLPTAPVTVNGQPRDWETCMTMNNSWGYSAEDTNFKDPGTIIRALTRCVSMGGNCLLNVGPDARGRIPAPSVAILERVGQWMEANGESVHGAGPAGVPAPIGCHYTAKPGALYLHLNDPPMGDIILPRLNGRIKHITILADGADVPLITHWGFELLAAGDIRIRPPKNLARQAPAVLKIELRQDGRA